MKVTFTKLADVLAKRVLRDLPDVPAHNASLIGKDLARATFRFWNDASEVKKEDELTYEAAAEGLDDLARTCCWLADKIRDKMDNEAKATVGK